MQGQKRFIWGRQRYNKKFSPGWHIWKVSFVLRLKETCHIDEQVIRFFTEFSELPLEKKIQLVKYIVIIWLMELFLFPGWATAPKDLAQTSYFLATNRLVFIMWYIHVHVSLRLLIWSMYCSPWWMGSLQLVMTIWCTQPVNLKNE